METVLHLIFAAIALGVLVFIHEYGHYWMARRVGMKVEIFSIGFGKPLRTWMHKGVKWQLGWLPFGGYVKIAEMDLSKEEKNAPNEEAKGSTFLSAKPIDRLKVAIAGPLANLILAFLVFTAIWLTGGRQKPFSDFTHRAGWVDPHAELYNDGLRPGDFLLSYNEHSIGSIKDLFYAAMFTKGAVNLEGIKINPDSGKSTPFEYRINAYQAPGAAEGLMTFGILAPARYLIYDKFAEGSENFLSQNSPMNESGIQPGDQIVWVNGETPFSMEQFSDLINQPRLLLTVKRGQKILLVKVPKVQIQELKLDPTYREELTDWQHQVGLKGKLSQFFSIPYEVTSAGVVEHKLTFIDPETEAHIFPQTSIALLEQELQPGDEIIAVDGRPISHAAQLLEDTQKMRVHLIVRRKAVPEVAWKDADAQFTETLDGPAIQRLALSIGTEKQLTEEGEFILLHPVVPKTMAEFASSSEQKAWLTNQILEQRKKIEALTDNEKRSAALKLLDESQQKLMLGMILQDREVLYNPPPYILFANVFDEVYRTFMALFSGSLNPKWLSGPIGIVQVIHKGWSVGSKEALYWIAAISMNLGLLNLLPIPVLDGGYILLSLVEMVTGKKVKAKLLERLILPFVVLLIAFFVFVTYYDLIRLF